MSFLIFRIKRSFLLFSSSILLRFCSSNSLSFLILIFSFSIKLANSCNSHLYSFFALKEFKISGTITPAATKEKNKKAKGKLPANKHIIPIQPAGRLVKQTPPKYSQKSSYLYVFYIKILNIHL